MARAKNRKTAAAARGKAADRPRTKAGGRWDYSRSPFKEQPNQEELEEKAGEALRRLDAETGGALLGGLSTDPLNRRDGVRTPEIHRAKLVPGQQVDARALRRAVLDVLRLTYDLLESPLGTGYPLEHELKAAKSFISFMERFRKKRAFRRVIANRARMLDELAAIYEHACASWPGDPPARGLSDAQVALPLTGPQEVALYAQANALARFFRRFELGDPRHPQVLSLIARMLVDPVYVAKHGGAVKVAAAMLDARMGTSATSFQKARVMSPLEVSRLILPAPFSLPYRELVRTHGDQVAEAAGKFMQRLCREALGEEAEGEVLETQEPVRPRKKKRSS